jgi:Sulfatase
VEYAEGDVAYYAKRYPVRAVVLPVIALDIIITLGLFLAWEFCRRRGWNKSRVLPYLFLVLCAAPAGFFLLGVARASPFDLTPMAHSRGFWPAVFVAAVVLLGLGALRPRRTSGLLCGTLLYSWPVLLVVLFAAYRGTLQFPPSAFAEGRPAAPVQSSPSRTRVVWIIFDEMSQTIAFGNRPADLALPNLDRFKSESFYATAAESPANSTLLSMPSLILGEKVLEATPNEPRDLSLRLSSHAERVYWSSLPNVFDTARELGFNTALVGWLHPYGRVLSRSLTECYWTGGWPASGVDEPSQPEPLVDGMWDRVALQFAALPLMSQLPGMAPVKSHRRKQLERFTYLSARAREIAADPAIGMALLHLPIPHSPSIYERSQRRFTVRERASYLDNVALADRELGLLWRAMEDAGLWDRTAVLISADHGWRTALWRGGTGWTREDEGVSHQDTSGIPFLVKLPGETSNLVYSKPFNTVLTRRVITGILDGRITDPAAVAATIEGR